MAPSPARVFRHLRSAAPAFFRGVAPSPPRTAVEPSGYGHSLARLPVFLGAPIQCTRGPGNRYKLPARSRKNLTGRSDRNRLDTHFTNIQEHYDQHKALVKRAQRLAAQHHRRGNLRLKRTWLKRARAAKAKITEAIGEQNATNKILKDRPTWRLRAGFSPGTGFDQVWETRNRNKINVVEAKGPGARLGVSDRKGRQLSKPWVKATAEGLAQDFGIAAALANGAVGGAGGVPKVRGYLIGSTATGKSAKKNWEKFTYN